MEAEVLEQEDLTVLAVLDGLLNLTADAVVEERNGLAEELLKLLGLMDGEVRRPSGYALDNM